MIKDFKSELEYHLRKAISDDYTRGIAELIADDVKEDLEVSADTNYNEDDLKLAIGRVLTDYLAKKNLK